MATKGATTATVKAAERGHCQCKPDCPATLAPSRVTRGDKYAAGHSPRATKAAAVPAAEPVKQPAETPAKAPRKSKTPVADALNASGGTAQLEPAGLPEFPAEAGAGQADAAAEPAQAQRPGVPRIEDLIAALLHLKLDKHLTYEIERGPDTGAWNVRLEGDTVPKEAADVIKAWFGAR